MPRKEYRPRKKGQSSSSSDIVEAPESDNQDDDWDDWFGLGTSSPTVDSNSDTDLDS